MSLTPNGESDRLKVSLGNDLTLGKSAMGYLFKKHLFGVTSVCRPVQLQIHFCSLNSKTKNFKYENLPKYFFDQRHHVVVRSR
jgi:hypothetical protein